jgi:hypothetical protein
MAMSLRVSQREGIFTISQAEGSQSRQTVKYGHESRGTGNQESVHWRGPAAIYWTGVAKQLLASLLLERVTTGRKMVLLT